MRLGVVCFILGASVLLCLIAVEQGAADHVESVQDDTLWMTGEGSDGVLEDGLEVKEGDDGDVVGEDPMGHLKEYLLSSFAKLYNDSHVPEISELSPEKFVFSSYAVPNAPSVSMARFVYGEKAKMVFGIENHWIRPIVVVGISGGIYSTDYSIEHQNLTHQHQWTPVHHSDSASLVFTFVPRTGAHEYGLLVKVDFIDYEKSTLHSIEVFRDIIEIIAQEESLFDFQSMCLYALLVAFATAGVYFIKNAFFSSPVPRKMVSTSSDWASSTTPQKVSAKVR